TGYTRADLDVWAECMERVLRAGDVGQTDVVQNAYGYGLFTGGLGFHLGAERIGCLVVPTSSGVTQRQATLLRDLGTTVLACTPSRTSSTRRWWTRTPAGRCRPGPRASWC